jgi:predicted enzyme related to lactoylglutathione lyase
MLGNHPVAFFEIVSPDAPKAQAFYHDLFGWTIDTDDDGYGLVETGAGEEAVSGGIGPSMAPNDRGVKVYVRTDDLEATIARAQELGSSVYLDPMDLPGGYGRIAVVSDPDGNPLGLWT